MFEPNTKQSIFNWNKLRHFKKSNMLLLNPCKFDIAKFIKLDIYKVKDKVLKHERN